MKLHHAICDEMGSLGVNLVLGEKPVIPDGTTGDIKLSGGNALHFDCLVSCQYPLFPVDSSFLTVSDQMCRAEAKLEPSALSVPRGFSSIRAYPGQTFSAGNG